MGNNSTLDTIYSTLPSLSMPPPAREISPTYPFDRVERPVEFFRRGDQADTDLKPLEPYLLGGNVYIANGRIRDPDTTPNIGGTPISDDPAPYLTPSTGTTTYVHLKLTYKPRTTLLATDYYAMTFAVDTITDAEFITSANFIEAGTDPVIDTSTGSVTTDAISYVRWASVTESDDVVTLNYATGTGHATLLFHPPDTLLVIQS